MDKIGAALRYLGHVRDDPMVLNLEFSKNLLIAANMELAEYRVIRQSLVSIVRRLDDPSAYSVEQARYNLESALQQARIIMEPGRKHEQTNMGDDRSCYYCRPSGQGSNDDDVIPNGPCNCWCHHIEPVSLVNQPKHYWTFVEVPE